VASGDEEWGNPSRDVGKLAGLLQNHALKRDHFFVKRKFCARHQCRIERFFDFGMIDRLQIDTGEGAIEPVRYHAIEQ
jgi:hypothetical protein